MAKRTAAASAARWLSSLRAGGILLVVYLVYYFILIASDYGQIYRNPEVTACIGQAELAHQQRGEIANTSSIRLTCEVSNKAVFTKPNIVIDTIIGAIYIALDFFIPAPMRAVFRENFTKEVAAFSTVIGSILLSACYKFVRWVLSGFSTSQDAAVQHVYNISGMPAVYNPLRGGPSVHHQQQPPSNHVAAAVQQFFTSAAAPAAAPLVGSTWLSSEPLTTTTPQPSAPSLPPAYAPTDTSPRPSAYAPTDTLPRPSAYAPTDTSPSPRSTVLLGASGETATQCYYRLQAARAQRHGPAPPSSVQRYS